MPKGCCCEGATIEDDISESPGAEVNGPAGCAGSDAGGVSDPADVGIDTDG